MSREYMLLIILITWMVVEVASKTLSQFLDMDWSYDLPTRDNYVSIDSDAFDSDDNLEFRRMEDLTNGHVETRKDYDFVAPLSFYTKRRQNLYPSVEIGPGAFKTEIIQHSPDTLKKQLSNLMRIKKKLEEERQLVP